MTYKKENREPKNWKINDLEDEFEFEADRCEIRNTTIVYKMKDKIRIIVIPSRAFFDSAVDVSELSFST